MTDYSDSDHHQQTSESAHRPGSRLKANIDELDTLLSDLNNAQNTRSTAAETSSEDYGDQPHLQGHVKKTIHSMSSQNEYNNAEYNRQKPPSPSPTRRRTPVMMNSPVPPARRTSPSPARRTSPPRSSSCGHGQSSPPRKRSPSPLGHAYYSKYHSTYSSSHQNNGPVSFPTCPSPSPNRGPTLQTPPKKVDDLMTELSEFDPSIQHVTSFAEPSTTQHRTVATKYTMDEEDSHLRSSSSRRREPSPIASPKQPSTPGPAVYYPPGELFSSTRNDDMIAPAAGQTSGQTETLDTTTSSNGARAARAKVRAEYGYKEKGRYQDAESKQGAAVVPICLPLCCAAPCVIL